MKITLLLIFFLFIQIVGGYKIYDERENDMEDFQEEDSFEDEDDFPERDDLQDTDFDERLRTDERLYGNKIFEDEFEDERRPTKRYIGEYTNKQMDYFKELSLDELMTFLEKKEDKRNDPKPIPFWFWRRRQHRRRRPTPPFRRRGGPAGGGGRGGSFPIIPEYEK